MKTITLTIPHESAPEIHHVLTEAYERLAATALEHDKDGEKTKALRIDLVAQNLDTIGKREIFGW